jgi:hypothetical protein
MNNKSVFQRLLRNIVIIVIIITALIIIQQKTYNDFISASISKSYLDDLSLRAEKQFRNFYLSVENSLIRSQKMGQSGVLVLQDIESMNATFIPILEELPQIHSVKIVSEAQQVYTLTRDKDLWISNVIDKKKDPHRVLKQYWSSQRQLLKQEWEDTDYNVFQRPWYLAAKDSTNEDRVSWTKLRIVESAGSQGITASIKWLNKKENNQYYVLAFDVLLKEILHSVSNLPVTEKSQVFLFRSDTTIFNLMPDKSLSDGDTLYNNIFIDLHQSENPLVIKAIKCWQEEEYPEDESIDFEDSQILYWLGMRLVDREHSNLWIGIITPQNDITINLQRRQLTNISISASIFLLGTLIVITMVRKHRKSITAGLPFILDDGDLEDKIKRLINKGEGRNIEFKSTMRMNLNTSQPGKEIELAWLKATTAFMNSDGGVLLLGVNDEGGFTGLEVDNFENEDKCRLHFKNLINQHIGAEFTNYLSFGLQKIGDKTIGILECTRSPKPVFLKNKNEEHFYIRSGPSSIKLQTSKILEYIEGRKA